MDFFTSPLEAMMPKDTKPAIPLLQIKNLCKNFGNTVVLDHINLSVFRGESFVILGSSGTGKSVLIKCILGLIEPDKGEILIDGKDIMEMDELERMTTLKRFGMLFQGGALFDSLTVAQNIAFGLIQGFGVSESEARQVALTKLKDVDLPDSVADLYPAELSGGMQKRVALARAIATNPEVVFFDEPTTGLDPILSSTINMLIKRCIQNINACTITITHDMKSLRQIGYKAGLLHKGNFVWQGLVSDIDSSNDPFLKQFISGNPAGPLTN